MMKIFISPDGPSGHWQATVIEDVVFGQAKSFPLPYTNEAGAALVQRDVEKRFPGVGVWIYRWADSRPAIA